LKLSASGERNPLLRIALPLFDVIMHGGYDFSCREK
jgi:hypothetical protein